MAATTDPYAFIVKESDPPRSDVRIFYVNSPVMVGSYEVLRFSGVPRKGDRHPDNPDSIALEPEIEEFRKGWRVTVEYVELP